MEIKDVKSIDVELKSIQEEIEKVEQEKNSLLLKLYKQKEKLETEKQAQIDLKRERLVAKLEDFQKHPTDQKMYGLLLDLKDIEFKEIEFEGEQHRYFKSMLPLFEYIYQKKDAKLVEKYLLAKMSYDEGDLEAFDADIERYKHHLSEEGYKDTDKSKYMLEGPCVFNYEIQQFMLLLGELDSSAKPEQTKAYISAETEKYIMRAIVGAYGYWAKYLYCDGEFGHKDHEKKHFEHLHEIGYTKQIGLEN